MRVENRFLELLARKARLEKRSISRRDVEVETGISMTSIQNWANNKATRFDGYQIAVFCKYLGCEVNELLVIVEGDETQSPENQKPPVAA